MELYPTEGNLTNQEKKSARLRNKVLKALVSINEVISDNGFTAGDESWTIRQLINATARARQGEEFPTEK